jgi:hypothetical protein
MDKRIAGLLGAAAALTAVNSAQAATTPTASLSPAASYRDLLEPVPNAVAALKSEENQGSEAAKATGETRLAYHHHHHRHWRRHHHHHHHHY